MGLFPENKSVRGRIWSDLKEALNVDIFLMQVQFLNCCTVFQFSFFFNSHFANFTIGNLVKYTVNTIYRIWMWWVFIHCFVTLSLFHWITIFILSLIRYWDFYWLFALVTNFDLRAIGLAITVQCQIKFSMLLQRTYRTCTQENGKGRPSWNN